MHGQSSTSDAVNHIYQRAGGILTVNLPAIAANYKILKDQGEGTECAAVVKANAYGLGMPEVVSTLWSAGCRRFFVATIEEALAFREHFHETWLENAKVAVFDGVLPGVERDYAQAYITPVINHLEGLARWQNLAREREEVLPAILHIDTGMNRLGLDAGELDILAQEPERLEGIKLEYIMSHLACADEPAHLMNALQLERFQKALAVLPKAPACFANSSGIFLGNNFHFDLLRPGIALYGGNPTPQAENPMQPVVTLEARILQIRNVESGHSVGYGADFVTSRPSRLATIALGYADGYLRAASGRARVYIDGVKTPVVGRISMDLIILDITDHTVTNIKVGDLVQVIGPDHTVDDVAGDAGTISYEILTSLGARYMRRYIGENKDFLKGS